MNVWDLISNLVQEEWNQWTLVVEKIMRVHKYLLTQLIIDEVEAIACLDHQNWLKTPQWRRKQNRERLVESEREQIDFVFFFFLVDVAFFNINNFFFNLSSHISLKCASSAPSLTCKHFPLVSWWNGPNWLQVENNRV